MNILLFGFGEMGKKLIQECLIYDCNVTIKAIVDNHVSQDKYEEIPIIRPDQIQQYDFDEIWICTVYFKEIRKQLEQIGIPRKIMFFVEPVLPILEQKILEHKPRNKEEIEVYQYLNTHHLRMYCYPFYDEYLEKDTEIFYDEMNGLFYGIYTGKKMYLAKQLNTKEKARAYFNNVIMEQDERSPHCYWNNKNMKEQTGVTVDIGAAEGIYGLQVIDQIDHLYMFEVNDGWIEALNYTYAAYKEKVTIIKKYIGNIDSENISKMDTVLGDKEIDSIKMDIEGMELEALLGAEKIITQSKPDLAICVYHHHNDNEIISSWLNRKGYETYNSNGIVLCHGEWELENDEVGFRKAILFANRG